MAYQPKTRQGNYFQFPLCFLSYGTTSKERLNMIISYCVVSCGLSAWDKRLPSDRAARASLFVQQKKLTQAQSQDSLLLAAVEGADVIGVICTDFAHVVREYLKLWAFIDAWEQRHGRDVLVRLRKDLVFEARDNKGISPRLLWTFAAAVSVIGDKQKPVRISQQTIRLRSQGYRSITVRNAEILKRVDSARPPTDWQIRADLNRLVSRKLLSRSTHARRQSYYSSRMTAKQLSKAVYDMKTARAEKAVEQFLNDLSLTQNIQNRIAQLKGKPLPHPNALPMDASVIPIPVEEVF